MRLSWKPIEQHHVADACALLATSASQHGRKSRGLFVRFKEHLLPAKDVARTAYLLAIHQPLDSLVDFASGEGLLDRLRSLGCDAVRLPAVENPEAR
jgi:hypothetical protein